MVTVVPPVAGPVVGLIEVMVGGGTYVKAPTSVPVPSGEVTETSTAPVPAGVTAVMSVSELTVKDVAAVPPKSTAVAFVKPVPVM